MLLAFVPDAAAEDGDASPARSPWSVALGMQTDNTGLHVFRAAGAYTIRPSLLAELAVTVRDPTASVVGDAEHQVVTATFLDNFNDDAPVSAIVEPFTVSAGADWAILPRPVDVVLSGGPRLSAGVQLRDRMTSDLYVQSDPGTEREVVVKGQPSFELAAGVYAGVGMDLWFRGRIGVCVRWTGGVFLATEPAYGRIDARTGAPATPAPDVIQTDGVLGAELRYAF